MLCDDGQCFPSVILWVLQIFQEWDFVGHTNWLNCILRLYGWRNEGGDGRDWVIMEWKGNIHINLLFGPLVKEGCSHQKLCHPPWPPNPKIWRDKKVWGREWQEGVFMSFHCHFVSLIRFPKHSFYVVIQLVVIHQNIPCYCKHFKFWLWP